MSSSGRTAGILTTVQPRTYRHTYLCYPVRTPAAGRQCIESATVLCTVGRGAHAGSPTVQRHACSHMHAATCMRHICARHGAVNCRVDDSSTGLKLEIELRCGPLQRSRLETRSAPHATPPTRPPASGCWSGSSRPGRTSHVRTCPQLALSLPSACPQLALSLPSACPQLP